jgi:N-acetylneuraminic acid mutarotase
MSWFFFGGDNHTHYLADTWIFDPTDNQWRKSAKAESPPARAGHFTVFDPATGWIIIGGGYNRGDLTDMWGYDLRSDQWHRLPGQVPSGFYISADIAPKAGMIVLTTATKREGDTMRCNEIYPVRTTWTYRIDKNHLEGAGSRLAP